MSATFLDPRCSLPTNLCWPVAVGRGSSDPTWEVANGPGYDRVARGYYAPSGRPRCVEQRIIDAAVRLHGDPARGVVTGWAGLRWVGARFLDGAPAHGAGELPVELHVNGSLMQLPGTLVSKRFVAPSEARVVDGLPVGTVPRCLFDEIARCDDLWTAVQAIDMAAAAELISAWVFATYVGVCNSRTGAPLARHAVSLAVDESRSPRETWMRLIWILIAGLDPPLVNQPVYDLEGRLIGIPDLFDPVAGLAGEYQGAHHKGIGQHRADVDRAERFRQHGIEIVEIVQGDTRDAAASRIVQARARAKFLAPAKRTWTLDPPRWVPHAETLDDKLVRLGLVEELSSPNPCRG